MKRLPLGDLLLSLGAIDALQLQAALGHHRRWGMPLGKAVLEKGFCSPGQLLQALAVQSGLPTVRLEPSALSPALAALIPHRVASQHRMVAIGLAGKRQEVLEIAVAAPGSLAALDAARSVSGKSRVVARLATDEELERALTALYGTSAPARATDTAQIAHTLSRREVELEFDEQGAAVPVQPARILVHGWPDSSARALLQLLASHELFGEQVDAATLSLAAAHDVVIAPLPAMEALAQRGIRVAAQLLAAGKHPEVDVPRARRLGAVGFLAAPLDNALLLRTLALLQRRAEQITANRV